jgi:hypothetical protein
MHRLVVAASVLVLAALVLAACGAGEPTPVSPGGPVVDTAGLVDALRAAGATVAPAGDVSQPFLSVAGQVLTVNGQALQVFEYADAAAAEADAATISPDARSTTTTMITWVADPHVYRIGPVIAIYVGADAGTLQLLEQVLGPQFAGA